MKAVSSTIKLQQRQLKAVYARIIAHPGNKITKQKYGLTYFFLVHHGAPEFTTLQVKNCLDIITVAITNCSCKKYQEVLSSLFSMLLRRGVRNDIIYMRKYIQYSISWPN